MKKIIMFVMVMLLCVAAVQAGEIRETIERGVTKTVTIDGVDYEIRLVHISNDYEKCKLNINGEVTDAMAVGDVDRIADGSKLEILDITDSKVLFYLGTPGPQYSCDGQTIVLEDAEWGRFRMYQQQYEIHAEKYMGNFRLNINGEYTDWLGIGSQYRTDTMKLEVLNIDPFEITFCMVSTIYAQEGIPETHQPEYKIDLSNFPELFMNVDEINAIFVVGDTAPADDVIAATDIVVGAFEGYKPISPTFLASEVDSLERNIISIGRPCDNPITARIMGVEDCTGNLKPGQALIKLYEHNGYAHLVVFGYSNFGTRYAARKLTTSEALNGKEILLEFTEQVMPEEPEVKPEISEEEYERERERREQKEPPVKETKEECLGCRKNGACMQIGIRLLEDDVPVYCDIDSAFKPQKENGEACMNNYECLSNTCQDGTCQSMSEKIESIREELEEQKGILEKIFAFINRIFS